MKLLKHLLHRTNIGLSPEFVFILRAISAISWVCFYPNIHDFHYRKEVEFFEKWTNMSEAWFNSGAYDDWGIFTVQPCFLFWKEMCNDPMKKKMLGKYCQNNTGNTSNLAQVFYTKVIFDQLLMFVPGKIITHNVHQVHAIT